MANTEDMKPHGDARSVAMKELYESGHTLAEIGARYGVSRERVRQILKKQGQTTALMARLARKAARDQKDAQDVASFLAEHHETIKLLAEAGSSKVAVEERFALVLPNVAASIVRSGIEAAGTLFNIEIQGLCFHRLCY